MFIIVDALRISNDQSQRDTEQRLELLEVGIVVCNQVLLVSKPEMN